MNAPVRIPEPGSFETPTPGDLSITVRDRRFGRGAQMERWWCGGDPIATAWNNSLSASFPRGEGLFIDSVKAFRDGAPPRLAQEIRAFVQQEVNHTREHLAFNRAAEQAGYDMTAIDAGIAENVARARSRPPIVQLAVTIALEHYTAMFARVFLERPGDFFPEENSLSDIWRWHAIEEIEHKGVAYDTYLWATRDWPRRRRWALRSYVMLDVTVRFIKHRSQDALTMLAQDGITGWKARARLYW